MDDLTSLSGRAQSCRTSRAATPAGYSVTRKRKRKGALGEVVEQLLLDRLRHRSVVVLNRASLRSFANNLTLSVPELREVIEGLVRRRMIAVVPFRITPDSQASGWEIRLSWAALS